MRKETTDKECSMRRNKWKRNENIDTYMLMTKWEYRSDMLIDDKIDNNNNNQQKCSSLKIVSFSRYILRQLYICICMC